MRRMYSEAELKAFIVKHADEVVKALKGKDIDVEGITSKGIANTGGLANIGDVAISGDLIVQGEGKGKIKGNTIESVSPLFEMNIPFPETSGDFTITPIYCKLIQWNHTLRIVFSLKLTNTAETAQNIPIFYSSSFTLDEEIASKIYDVDGKTLAEDPLIQDTLILIRGALGEVFNYGGGPQASVAFMFRRWNKIPSFGFNVPTHSVPAGESRYIFGEMSINL